MLRPLMDWFSSAQLRAAKDAYGETVIIIRYYDVLSRLYESAAILGHARNDKLDILEEMLYFPIDKEIRRKKVCSHCHTENPPNAQYCYHCGTHQFNSSFLVSYQGMSTKRLSRYKQRYGKEPATFDGFISSIGFFDFIENATGVSMEALRNTPNGSERFAKASMQEIKLEITTDNCWVPSKREIQLEVRKFFLEGIGFGSLYPELAIKMNHNYWESVRSDFDRLSEEWTKAKLALPSNPGLAILSYKEQEERVLDMTAEFARAYYPQLIDSLDLKLYTHGFTPYVDWIKLVDNIGYFQSQTGR